jgi:hypothetical protein
VRRSKSGRTCGGPRMVPFQSFMSRSSLSCQRSEEKMLAYSSHMTVCVSVLDMVRRTRLFRLRSVMSSLPADTRPDSWLTRCYAKAHVPSGTDCSRMHTPKGRLNGKFHIDSLRQRHRVVHLEERCITETTSLRVGYTSLAQACAR